MLQNTKNWKNASIWHLIFPFLGLPFSPWGPSIPPYGGNSPLVKNPAVFDGVGLAGFKSRANAFLLASLLAPFLSPSISLSLLSSYGLVLWGWCLLADRVLINLSLLYIANLFNNYVNNTYAIGNHDRKNCLCCMEQPYMPVVTMPKLSLLYGATVYACRHNRICLSSEPYMPVVTTVYTCRHNRICLSSQPYMPVVTMSKK